MPAQDRPGGRTNCDAGSSQREDPATSRQWKSVDCFDILCLVMKGWRLPATFFGKLVVWSEGGGPRCGWAPSESPSLTHRVGLHSLRQLGRIMRMMLDGGFRSQAIRT